MTTCAAWDGLCKGCIVLGEASLGVMLADIGSKDHGH